MRFDQLASTLTASFSILLCSSNEALAGIYGPLTYSDTGTSITIESCSSFSVGNIVIPDVLDGKPVTAIADGAFYACRRVTGVTIPLSVNRIGKQAFNICDRLAYVNLPEGITEINESTFSGCDALQEVKIPASVKQIGEEAFSSSGLININVPSGVNVIGNGAFKVCRALKKARLPEALTEIGDYVFDFCPNLLEVKMPSSVVRIGVGAFASSGITSIDLGSSLIEIKERAFSNCEALDIIAIPKSVTRIGAEAFMASGIKNIDMRARLTRIEERTFADCKSLVIIAIPETVAWIGNGAFASCDNLVSGHFNGNAPGMGKDVFEDSSSDFRIFIPDGAKGYTIPRWKGYGTSLPREEITVLSSDGSSLVDGDAVETFGGVILSAGSTKKRFTIRNVGTRKLKGLNATIQGGDFSDFTVKNLSKGSLASGKQATLEIEFAPREKGKRSSTLLLMSSDASEDPFEIELTGKGLKLLE